MIDTNTHYIENINPRFICNIQSYKAYKYFKCCIILQSVAMPDITYYNSYDILFLPTQSSTGLHLQTKLILPICFHLSFVQRQSPSDNS